MRELAERAYFGLCLVVGRVLRSARYSTTLIVDEDGRPQVRKRRAFYAPLLISMSGPLVRILDTGVRVLPQREWEERERMLYRSLRGTSVRTDAEGAIILPYLAGKTLATLLDDPQLEDSVRTRSIECAVAALVELHRVGFTHGDAMAENVMVDVDAGIAHWFDFENTHDTNRPLAWRRADDVRALLSTCVARTAPAKRAETIRFILDGYEDEEVTSTLATSFASLFRRPLCFHLGQATLSVQAIREISQSLRERRANSLAGD